MVHKARILISVALALLLPYLAMAENVPRSASEVKFDFVYADPVGHLGRLSYNMQNHTTVVGDVQMDLLTCPTGFKCLAGGAMRFAIPDSARHEWDAFGQHFQIDSLRTVRILGEEIRVTLIKSSSPEVEVLYMYSENRGLVGFGALGVPTAQFFWLEGRCGFAAKNCR